MDCSHLTMFETSGRPEGDLQRLRLWSSPIALDTEGVGKATDEQNGKWTHVYIEPPRLLPRGTCTERKRGLGRNEHSYSSCSAFLLLQSCPAAGCVSE